MPQSVKKCIPCTNVNFYKAKRIAKKFEKRKGATSHLIYGAEYDSILEWFIESKARSEDEIKFDCGNWGNFHKSHKFNRVVKTGSNKQWCTNNISDFSWNVTIWTQEENGIIWRSARGGCFLYASPVSTREFKIPLCSANYMEFRIAIFIK